MRTMPGIVAYGSYVPYHRLRRSDLASALGSPDDGGMRAVAAYDEDTTTMGVEAARAACASGAQPSGVYLATSAPVYADKTNATAIHAALDWQRSGFAVDLAGSVRGAVGALRTAAALGGMAVLSDMRTGRPGSADERTGGDGAAAFVFGDGEPLAEILAEASVTAEFLDRWRAPGALASDRWEERFGLEAYTPLIAEATAAALDRAGLKQTDHVLVSSPHLRAAAAATRRLTAKLPEQPLGVGYCGAADPGLRLAAVLDRARPGETILLAVAADGCDAQVLRVGAAIDGYRSAQHRGAAAGHGGPRDENPDGSRQIAYTTYLTWRGLLEREPPRRPDPGRPAAPPSHRSRAWKFAFVGSACEACGRVHAPPRRVCVCCGSVDRMRPAPLAGRSGSIVTYTIDRLAFSPSPPLIEAVVDFDGGGRCTLEVTDAGPEQVSVGAPVKLTFRRLYTVGGVHNYFWKVRPG